MHRPLAGVFGRRNGRFTCGVWPVEGHIHAGRRTAATPEAYSDLIVRVAGFSAYFTQLSRDVQEEIISRTAHAL